MAPKKAEARQVVRTSVVKASTVDQAKKREVLAIMNKINRAAKKNVIRFAEEAPNTYYLRRPSGIMQLDIDSGGGLPAGGFVTISGPDNAGKSFLLYKYFATHQRIFGPHSCIAYASPEGAIDFWWARKIGWMVAVPDEIIEAEQRNRQLRGVPPLTREEIAELKTEIGINVRVDHDTGEKLLDSLLTLIQSRHFGIIALDSLESVMPGAEAGLDSFEDNPQQAARAGLLTRFMMHYGAAMSGTDGPNYTTLIGTCQVRSNRKKAEVASHYAKYMKDWASTAPRAIRHWRLLDITVESGEKIKKEVNGVKTQIGKMLDWEITKGKAGTHEGIKGEVAFEYGGLIDELSTVLVAGMRYGVIEEKDGRLTLHRESGPDSEWVNIPGRDEFIGRMANNLDDEMMVRREILSAAGVKCLYR